MIFTQTRYLTTFSLITCSCSHVCFREIPRRISIRACYQDFESSRKYILRPNSKFHFELYKSLFVNNEWNIARDWFARALTMCALVITRRSVSPTWFFRHRQFLWCLIFFFFFFSYPFLFQTIYSLIECSKKFTLPSNSLLRYASKIWGKAFENVGYMYVVCM